MDYKQLAVQFMESMHMLHRARPHKRLNESMQGEAFVLQFLSYHQGYVLPSEISNVMGISSARVAAALNSLERKGLINRQIDPSDRRRILVSLTLQGKQLAADKEREMMEKTSALLSLLGEDDAKEYIRLTRRLAELAVIHKETWE
jgi:DNA-binding MarR family transcriptional regulator